MKTVSLELAKQLKENGYSQVSEFYWIKDPYEWELRHLWRGAYPKDDLVSAPTADEILDQLPNFIAVVLAGGGRHGEHVSYHVWENVNSRMLCAQYGWKPERTGMHQEEDKNLSDACAKMWLYLKKEGLL